MSALAAGEQRRWNPFRSWTLRRKLVVTVVAVVVLLGVLIGSISVIALRGYLYQRLDEQLDVASNRSVSTALGELQQGEVPNAGKILDTVGVPPGTIAAVLAEGHLIGPPQWVPVRADTEIRQPTITSDFPAVVLGLPNGSVRSVDIGGTLHEYRLVSRTLPGAGIQLVIGLPTDDVAGTTTRMIAIMVVLTLSAALIASGAGWLIVRLALRPLDRVAEAAETVTDMPLDRGEVALAVRVPEQDTDPRTEVGRVGSAFNAMLGHVASALSYREASERKVRQFVSDASHELRTPLASIRGYSELTRRSGHELPDDVVRSIGRIESEAGRMTAIVEDLLLLARLDEGRELDRDPVDLSMLAIDLLSDAHAAGPDHSWLLDELPGEPVEIIGDAARLHQVFANLLANARVHTPAGTTVRLGLAIDGADAVVTVADDGPGIPPELRTTLFERFARGDSSRSRETGSTGLGLAIVKAIVEAHHGTVGVVSEQGRTAFTVRLPLGEATDAASAAPTVATSAPSETPAPETPSPMSASGAAGAEPAPSAPSAPAGDATAGPPSAPPGDKMDSIESI